LFLEQCYSRAGFVFASERRGAVPTVSEQKKMLRSQMKEILRDYCAAEDFVQASANARRAVLESDAFARADIVLGYLFHGNEADCTDVLYRALAMGKAVGLPRVVPGTSDMDFYLLDGTLQFGDQIECGAFGISEPVKSLDRFSVDGRLCGRNILMLVPGVAFTKDGKRLGRGKGFYDRYIARLRETCASVTAAGFCFPCQIVDDVPVDAFDARLDAVFR